MDVFGLHGHVIAEYAAYTRSFIHIADGRIRKEVDRQIEQGLLWPHPLIQLNPSYTPGASVDGLVRDQTLHEECGRIFRIKEHDNDAGKPLTLHKHQSDAIGVAREGRPYLLTTGTGSGKSLSFIIPIVDHILRRGPGRGIQAIIVYPMNALANSQVEELDKFLKRGYSGGTCPVSYRRYTGQETSAERDSVLSNPPDILLTNYVMLELILTRIEERELVHNARGMRFLVLDELHTYRGRQGADVAMLVRRCREAMAGENMICVGTSATMASEGDSVAQAAVVADVASRIFGQIVQPADVIGESLVRATNDFDSNSEAVMAAMRARITGEAAIPEEYEKFCADPLAAWIETTFGLHREASTGKLVRRRPRAVRGETGAGTDLAKLTGTSTEAVETVIERYLLAGSRCRKPGSEYPLFAFRLHQFITRGDTVWSTIEPEEARYLTLRAQRYVPGDRDKSLFPLVFCRHCGQAYYRIDRVTTSEGQIFVPRERFEKTAGDDCQSGYLYLSSDSPWPQDAGDAVERVPDDWVEVRPDGAKRIRPSRNPPQVMRVLPDGRVDDAGTEVAFLPTPFRFCLNPKCRVAYNARQRSEAIKLATIGVDGRSTATSVLSLAAILRLRRDESLERKARKLLSFTDNRQDASLQAGHFNDFTEVGLVRSALLRAMQRAGDGGLRYDELTQHVERAMDLPLEHYANDPDIRGPLVEETRRALRSVLGYLLYRDLQRGLRLTSPNLEECGLLRIEYLGATDLAADDAYWQEQQAHGALVAAAPQQRLDIINALLDHLRRSLAIKEDALTRIYQERISAQSMQRLCDPWVIEDLMTMDEGCVAWPRSRQDREHWDDLFISPMSNFGLFLKRPGVLPPIGRSLGQDDVAQLVADLFRCLKRWGLVEEVRTAPKGTTVPGYQVPASIMVWKPGDGSKPMVDRLRVTQETQAAHEANRFFIRFYTTFADFGAGLEAREHTAQVPSELRQEREAEFRTAELPILFCSPTMELGVDIAQLNVVNMRNVPPTPANYAQRSGRAGRSGQPAFVYTYCSGFSPHDRYYFQHPHGMVAGQVSPPRLDLLNRDLVQSHVQAIWLAEAEMNLGRTLADVLTVSESDLALPVRDLFRQKLESADVRLRTLRTARRVLASVGAELARAPWYREGWLEDVLSRIPRTFDAACDRWRSIYRAAVQQRHIQNKVIGDPNRPQDRDRAKRLRAQAESQIQLLLSPDSVLQGDFYSYRYFASEGFLPGYNFPRLPLSAFIPARRGRRGRDEFLSRPRFLAIAEFGPRAVIYHEGSRYRVNKVNLAFDADEQELFKAAMKVCGSCGYGHRIETEPGPSVCENCRQPLLPTSRIDEMVRLQNVSAKRVDRITSDEEERQRIGYELRSTFRFADVDGQLDVRSAEVVVDEGRLAMLRYGDAATIWRINMGWLRRAIPSQLGFLLDVERGYWATNRDVEENDQDDPMSPRIERVVPYVEDRRNVLVIQFATPQDLKTMASLQAAMKESIQMLYQLEPSELAAEPLPSRDDRRLLFLYESAEGGAGVLRQIVEDPTALPRVARHALELCHFDPDTTEDLGTLADGGRGCEAGCYDCLLDYGNQLDHRLLDRKLIRDLLRALSRSSVVVGAGARSRAEQLQRLHDRCDSELERRWLKFVDEKRLKIPSDGQYLIEACGTRPDFYYADTKAAIFIDGPPHDDPHEQAKDARNNEKLIDCGYLVVRFHHRADWNEIANRYRDVFGI